jgi:hypothetical protein
VIVLDVICRAREHDSESARRRGCVCPVDWGSPFRRPSAQRTYVPGRVINRHGPRRSTVLEPDEVAVDRALGGDRSLRLAVTERDAAIDRLDRYGLSAQQIAHRLGITMRTVQRRRAMRRAVAS